MLARNLFVVVAVVGGVAALGSSGCAITTTPACPNVDCNGACCAAGESCINGACTSNVTCSFDGTGCRYDAECCSFLCDPATLTCGTTVNNCVEDNAPCTADNECCSGICAGDGYCGLPVGPGCASDGSPCQADGDCCSAEYCDLGSCSVCVSSGGGCTYDGDCCSGFCGAGACQ